MNILQLTIEQRPVRVRIDLVLRLGHVDTGDAHNDVHVCADFGSFRKLRRLAYADYQIHTAIGINYGSDGTHRDHLILTHMEWLVRLSARRLDLNVVPRPAAKPRTVPLRAEPGTRELSARIVVRKDRVGRTVERRKAGGTVPHLACPIVRPKVVQYADKHFVRLSYVRDSISVPVHRRETERT
jgi:hypothetical protein